MNWIQNFLHFFIKEVEVEVEVEVDEGDIHKERLESGSHLQVNETGKESFPPLRERETVTEPFRRYRRSETGKEPFPPLRERETATESFRRYRGSEAGKEPFPPLRERETVTELRFRGSEMGKELFHRFGINESGKDIEARITYQYPKGRSHSLSIPKETVNSSQKQRDKRKKKTLLKNIPVHQDNIEREQIANKAKETQAIKNKPKQVTKPVKTQDYRLKSPFQPTEIPSPVFGFNRPYATKPYASKQEPEVVEHELSHFIKEELHPPVVSEDVREEFPAEPVPAPALEEQGSVAESRMEEAMHGYDSQNELLPGSAGHTPEFENETYIQEEKGATLEETTVSSEAYMDTSENSSLEEENGIAEVAASSEEENPRPRKSHIPFNVMMLKKDKQKWEDNKRKRVEQQKTKVPSLFHQIANMGGETKETIIQESDAEPQPEQTWKGSNAVIQNHSENEFYQFPHSGLLHPPVIESEDGEWIEERRELLNLTLQNFNVGASVVNVTQGPSVTRFEVQPEPGVKVNKITNLTDDIKLSLAARDIRMEAPIPGKHTIGIEVPNQKSRPVLINEIIQSNVFHESSSPLTAVLGLDISGKPIVTDLKKMPHGLIAGATGSGKSVCINSILVSLLYKATPQDLKLLLIDPKMVELAPYNRIPHLVSPVITDVKAATAALKWAVEEMERRYELFAHTGVRDINRFNELAMEHKRYSDKLPFIVIIIDELADLMMMSPADVEEAICRIAQKARACGIHLIVATQRPSVDVITGLIKANIPTRIAFSVSSQVDSRTIIDISGAEKLLGRGDMLFLENGSSKPVRLQGTFVSDDEIDLVVAHVREQQEPEYLFQQDELLKKAQVTEEEDELFYEACEFIIDQGGASTSSLQRRFKIGYNRAARLMDMLENQGYISSAKGSRPREVLITEAELEAMQESV